MMKYLYILFLLPIYTFALCNGTPYGWTGSDMPQAEDGCAWRLKYTIDSGCSMSGADPYQGYAMYQNNPSNEVTFGTNHDGTAFQTCKQYEIITLSGDNAIPTTFECTSDSSAPICTNLEAGTLTYLPSYPTNTEDTSCEADGNIQYEISNTPNDSNDNYYGCFSFTPSAPTDASGADNNQTNNNSNDSTNTGSSNTSNNDSTSDNTGSSGNNDTSTNGNTNTGGGETSTSGGGGSTTGTTSTGGGTTSTTNDNTRNCPQNSHFSDDVCLCNDGYYDNGFGWCFLIAPDLPITNTPTDTNNTNGLDINPLVTAINSLKNQNHRDTLNISNRNHTDLSSIDSSIIGVGVSTNIHLSDIEVAVQNSSTQNHTDLATISNSLDQLNDTLTSNNENSDNNFTAELDDANIIQASNNTTSAVNDLLDYIKDSTGVDDEIPISEGTTSDLSNAVDNLKNSLSELDTLGDTLEATMGTELEASFSDFKTKSQSTISNTLDDVFSNIFNPMQPFENAGKNLNNFRNIDLPVSISSINYSGHIILTQSQVFGEYGSPLSRFYLIMQVVLQLIAALGGFFYLVKEISNV